MQTVASADPRIQTTQGSHIVFYNVANTGFIDIQVQAVQTMSDARFKTNVAAIGESGKALSLVSQLKGVEYNLVNDPNGKKKSGFIAQDLEKVLPHLVTTDDSVGNKLVDYQAIIPYLVEAIKEQQVQIESLKKQLTASREEEIGQEALASRRTDEKHKTPTVFAAATPRE